MAAEPSDCESRARSRPNHLYSGRCPKISDDGHFRVGTSESWLLIEIHVADMWRTKSILLI
jgi:hypothetical protein